MKRFLALLSLVAITATGTPAVAHTSPCTVTEQVYGVTRFGDLIVQPFCETPTGAYLPPRTLASFGTQVPRLFYGGQLDDHTVIIYGVGSDGALRWYRENGITRRLDPGVVVGSQYGDWRGYRHLQSAGDGDLSGVDGQGRLRRWVHLGWQDGADLWGVGAPEDAGKECLGTRPVFAGRFGPDLYVGVEALAYTYCGYDGISRTASLLPHGVEAPTMAVGPGVTYALGQADHRLTRMTLDLNEDTPAWRVGDVAQVAFYQVFTGRSLRPEGPPMKYEWQWTWYEEDA